jgi:hypothetical protein
MIYFGFRVSRLFGHLLSISSKVIFPECTDLCRMSMPSTTRVSSSYLSGTSKKYQSMVPPFPYSQVCRSLSCVLLQWMIMIFSPFRVSGVLSPLLLVSYVINSCRVHGSLPSVLPDIAAQICSRLPSFGVFHSLLVCKFLKCFSCGVSVLSAPIHMALTHGTKSRNLWEYHPLIFK